MSRGYISNCGPSCGPSCAIPSCLPSCGAPCGYPVSGLGSLSSCGGMYGGMCGGATTASSLGIVPGANVGCINQLPPSEVVIQPAPVVVTIPGPVLAASCEPTRVGGYTACGGGSSCGRLSYPC